MPPSFVDKWLSKECETLFCGSCKDTWDDSGECGCECHTEKYDVVEEEEKETVTPMCMDCHIWGVGAMCHFAEKGRNDLEEMEKRKMMKETDTQDLSQVPGEHWSGVGVFRNDTNTSRVCGACPEGTTVKVGDPTYTIFAQRGRSSSVTLVLCMEHLYRKSLTTILKFYEEDKAAKRITFMLPRHN